jgi:uncharacterized LabA/DUF88 family protein
MFAHRTTPASPAPERAAEAGVAPVVSGPRTAVLIDASYLLAVLRDEHAGIRIPLPKLVKALAGGRSPTHARYYTCLPYMSSPPTRCERARWSAEHARLTRLQQEHKIRIRLGRLTPTGIRNGAPTFVQKQVDVLLATDLVELALTNEVDRIVLVAGDGDFVPAVDLARRHGVRVCLVHGARHGKSRCVSEELFRLCAQKLMIDPSILGPRPMPQAVAAAA